MSSFLIFDLETVRDESVPWTPKTPDAFPPPPCWQVVCIGSLLLTEEYKPVRLGVVDGQTEAEQIAAFSEFVQAKTPDLVSYNGRSFDMPVLVARAMRHGLSMRYAFGKDVRYRYSTEGHLDLADQLSDYGACPKSQLNAWCHLVGAPGKAEVSGADVGEMVAAGRLEDVRAYCLRDVVGTALVLLRFEAVRGRIPRRRLLELEAGLLDFAKQDPRMGSFRAETTQAIPLGA